MEAHEMAMFDRQEWISTERHVMIDFDYVRTNMALFDSEEGFSTNAD